MENEKRFDGKADIYKQFRPSYPKELIDYMYSQVGITPDSVIADIGSGTGIFSRFLLERGSKVYCIEPNDDMRQVAETDLAKFENFISVNATAENTMLEEKSVDFITAAQAVHWFDGNKFKAECQRILKPGRKVVMVYNCRDNEHEIVVKDYIIREKYCMDKKGLGDNSPAAEQIALEIFTGTMGEIKVFRNDLLLGREAFIGRNLSASHAPRKETDPEKYDGLVRELDDLFDEYSTDGVLQYPHYTRSYVGTIGNI